MLGLARHEPHVETAVLPVGGTALLFTDGLVEDRDDPARRQPGEAAGRRGRGRPAPTSRRSPTSVMSLFGPREDDVAMIAVRRTARTRR